MRKSYTIIWMLIVLLTCMFFSVGVFAEEEGDTETVNTSSDDLYLEPDILSYVYEGDLDNDELFKEYVQHVLYEDIDQPDKIKETSIKAKSSYKLGIFDTYVYQQYVAMISDVAAGERSSTIFEVDAASAVTATFGKNEWTSEELGTEIVVDGAISQDAIDKMRELLGYHPYNVFHALLYGNTYELYWYNKTVSISITQNCGLTAKYNGSEYVMGFSGSFVLKMPVAAFYAGEEEYTVDIDKCSAASDTASAAKTFVNSLSDKRDIDKLIAYRRYICDQVEYNFPAAEGEYDYGDPWQLIYVFDNDPDTNVVCEGYAKAFQYLCDLSDFRSEKIDSIIVNGELYNTNGFSGYHMWNIVTMENGKNYLTDITNCDTGMIGADDKLFLVGKQTGSVDDGYRYDFGNNFIRYTYNDPEGFMKETYTDEELTLSNEDYAEPVIYLQYSSLSMEGNIGVNFKMSVPSSIYDEDTTIVISHMRSGGDIVTKTYKATESQTDESADPKVYSMYVPAKELFDSFNVKAYRDGNEVRMIVFSTNEDVTDTGLDFNVKEDYIEELEKITDDPELLEFLERIEDYVDASAIYFGYSDAQLDERSLAAINSVTGEDLKDYIGSTEGAVSGIRLAYTSLVHNEETVINFKFELDGEDPISSYTFRFADEEEDAAPEKRGSLYVVSKTNIKANELQKNYELTVTKANESQSITYSALAYVNGALNYFDDVDLLNSLKAMYLYNRAAVNYFN